MADMTIRLNRNPAGIHIHIRRIQRENSSFFLVRLWVWETLYNAEPRNWTQNNACLYCVSSHVACQSIPRLEKLRISSFSSSSILFFQLFYFLHNRVNEWMWSKVKSIFAFLMGVILPGTPTTVELAGTFLAPPPQLPPRHGSSPYRNIAPKTFNTPPMPPLFPMVEIGVLPFSLPVPPGVTPLIKQDIIPDHGCLAYNYSHTMVNKQTFADPGSGMYFYPSPKRIAPGK